MREQVEKITGLLDKYLKEELSPEEKSELDQWVMEDERNRTLFQQVTNKKILAEKLKTYSQVDSEALWQSTLQKINNEGKVIAIPVIPGKKTWLNYAWVKYAAAAAVVGVSITVWQVIDRPGKTNSSQPATVVAKNYEVNPGTFKAQLELVDGKTIALTTKETSIPRQGANELKVTNEGLVYVPDTKKEGNEVTKGNQYNTVTTFNGGEYQFTLPDGSRVRLNAASSLRFPIAFAGNERHVQLTGEAYFEVENAGKIPFIVSVNNGTDKECDVQVLGTHFNVMAYADEPGTQTTLLEGSVKIMRENASKTIKPGQQASVSNKEIRVKDVNTYFATAWKEGKFAFDGYDIKSVMRQIARWYDVKVEYDGNNTPEKQFDGEFPRDAKIDVVLQVLEANEIHARVEERKLIITQ